eukprot:CAMPEP_0119311476 /NCGR_PEP_ID=MMETSP1333-20130426/22538_1 /TAXON_ID=418940 /ORGANISM="Scyphosphaera apsteinii, Strain RCC1455" /LENGTH=51 /DNA_ID=CAMNT_0007315851 /DNA_START=34 /DNA_END=189 /DNA_ORIENTATION=-
MPPPPPSRQSQVNVGAEQNLFLAMSPCRLNCRAANGETMPWLSSTYFFHRA